MSNFICISIFLKILSPHLEKEETIKLKQCETLFPSPVSPTPGLQFLGGLWSKVHGQSSDLNSSLPTHPPWKVSHFTYSNDFQIISRLFSSAPDATILMPLHF